MTEKEIKLKLKRKDGSCKEAELGLRRKNLFLRFD
jgi:hypothetical protein